MLGTIFFLLFASLVCFAIYRITLKYKPKLFYNKDGKMGKILLNMETTKKPYQPTPWLFNCHLQTIYGLRLRGRSSYKPQREDVHFKDNGQVTIEYFAKENLPDDAPILYIIHTLGGGSRESCTNFMATYFMKNSYRVVICSCRGCNGSKITSRRLFNGYQTDDLITIISQVSQKYPSAKNKFLIGFSLGSMIAAQYGTDCNESDIDGIICISHSLQCAQGLSKIETSLNRTLYYDSMMNSLKHLVKKSSFYNEEEKKAVMKTKRFREFDEIVTAKNMGLNNVSEYYDLLDLKPKVLKIKVPTLFILAEDDPFTSPDWIPMEEINKSEYVAFITTKEGGHVSFAQGFNNKVSYSEEVCFDFCKTISEIKTH